VSGFEWTARVRVDASGPARVSARGHDLLSDSSLGLGLRDSHPSSLDFLLAALGGDLALRMQTGLRRAGLAVDSFEVKLHATLEDPMAAMAVRGATGTPALREIRGRCWLSACLEPAEEEEAGRVWQEARETSPVMATLARACPIYLDFSIL
jgi:hypothetical protein